MKKYRIKKEWDNVNARFVFCGYEVCPQENGKELEDYIAGSLSEQLATTESKVREYDQRRNESKTSKIVKEFCL